MPKPSGFECQFFQVRIVNVFFHGDLQDEKNKERRHRGYQIGMLVGSFNSFENCQIESSSPQKRVENAKKYVQPLPGSIQGYKQR